METQSNQLISHIAPAFPATHRPDNSSEQFVRPEIGFIPKWYQHSLIIKFVEYNWIKK